MRGVKDVRDVEDVEDVGSWLRCAVGNFVKMAQTTTKSCTPVPATFNRQHWRYCESMKDEPQLSPKLDKQHASTCNYRLYSIACIGVSENEMNPPNRSNRSLKSGT